jgi:putative transposase
MIAQVQQDAPELPLTMLCRLFGVSRSGYYTSAANPADAASKVALRDAIEDLVLAFPGYGYRRVTKQLQREGWLVNHKRVLRIMREELLLCQLRRRFVLTTDSAHGGRTYPNRLTGKVLNRLDQAWVADMTYIRLPTSFVYLAAILDAYSRRCIGWALSRTIDTALTLAALDLALQQRQPAPGVIHHSDRGVQYANQAYVARLEEAGLQLSMSASGNPYDNAKAESFFKTLKIEEVYLHEYQTFAEAEANLGRFIGDVYNHKRLHSSLGYVPPVEFEAAYALLESETPSLEVVR